MPNAFPSPDCLRCETCSPGCAAVAHTISSSLAQAMRRAQGRVGGPPLARPRQCWHCAQAPCVEACPAGAMQREATRGLVVVDHTRCVGCWMCVLACPFGAVVPDASGRFPAKCDGCYAEDVAACGGACGPRDSFLGLVALDASLPAQRAGLARAGWSWPPVESYPAPRATALTPTLSLGEGEGETRRPSPAVQQSRLSAPALFQQERESAPPLPLGEGRGEGDPRRYLIVGGGIAAVRAVEAIRQRDGEGRVVVVSAEPLLPYSRVLLPQYLRGEKDEAALWLRPPAWWTSMGVELIAGDGAIALDAPRRRVRLASGRVLSYDRLLVATGATPDRLPVPGGELAGVLTFHTLASTAAMREQRPRAAVVVGAGFVALKAAEALQAIGLPVTLLVRSRLLRRTLDVEGGRLVEQRLRDRGLTVALGAEVQAIEGRAGRASAVTLVDGRRFAADLMVLCTGVRASTAWLAGSGVRVGRGVAVDARLQTSVPAIWAAGDVAETRDLFSGQPVLSAIWPAAAEQGRLAGAGMAGAPVLYDGSLALNTLDVLGLPLASFGDVAAEAGLADGTGTGGYARRYYRQGRLVGAVLVGDIAEAGRLLAQARRDLTSSPNPLPLSDSERGRGRGGRGEVRLAEKQKRRKVIANAR